MTIKEWYSSLASHVNEKSANPFFAALTFTWLVHNWILIYSLFTFHDDMSRQAKLTWIKKYIHEDQGEILWVIQVDHHNLLYSPIVWAIGVILIFPAFNNMALIINTAWTQYVRLFILKKMDNRKVVAIEKYKRKDDLYEDLKEEYEEYIEMYDKYREDYGKVDLKLSQKTAEHQKLSGELTIVKQENTDLHNAKSELDDKVQRLINQSDIVTNHIKEIARYTGDTSISPAKLFEGVWIREYIKPTGEKLAETFEVKSDNKFYLEHAKNPMCEIKDLGMDNAKKTLAFRIAAFDGELSILNILKIVDPKKFTGIQTSDDDFKEVPITYTKRGF